MKAKPKIGIFAGTFDPIHKGHIAFAKAALDIGLEKVMFVPEPRPRRKQGVHALEHRVRMVQLAVADEPGLGTVILEQSRFSPLETLPLLQERFYGHELVLLFGDDVVSHMIDHLTDWPHVEQLAQASSLIIAARSEDQKELTEKLSIIDTEVGVPFRYQFVEPGTVTFSSSRIRLALKHGTAPKGLMPATLDYITEQGLYKSDEIIS